MMFVGCSETGGVVNLDHVLEIDVVETPRGFDVVAYRRGNEKPRVLRTYNQERDARAYLNILVAASSGLSGSPLHALQVKRA